LLLLLYPATLVLGVMAAMVAIPKPPLLLLCPDTLMLGMLAATLGFSKFPSLLLIGVIAATVLFALAVGVMA
jgi:hypothetical protein